MGQTQFRDSDTVHWWLGFGNGKDGDWSVSADTTETVVDSAATATSGTQSISATNASFVVGDAIFIHQTIGDGHGELNQISGYTAGTITTKTPLHNSYTTGAQVRVVRQYRNVTIDSGKVLTCKSWTGAVGGLLMFFCNGVFTRTGTIYANGGNNTPQGNPWTGSSVNCGFSGGLLGRSDEDRSAFQGYGTNSVTSLRTTAKNGNGGGGGTNADNQDGGAGGGNATAGSSTGGSVGGDAVGNAELTLIQMGGGGGGGAVRGDTPGIDGGGKGGGGGAIVYIFARSTSGIGAITANGSFGSDARSGYGYSENPDSSGGGGGAGGSICIITQDAINVTNISAVGGVGGAGNNGGNAGGNGSNGRIHVSYRTSISGTTTPTLDSTQDTTLTQPIKRRLVI